MDFLEKNALLEMTGPKIHRFFGVATNLGRPIVYLHLRVTMKLR